MVETPHKRAGDGANVGVSPAEQERQRNIAHPGTGMQEDAGSALHPPHHRAADDRSQGASNPMTPPPEARTDWPRGVGELGTEGMDPSQPLNEEPRPGREP